MSEEQNSATSEIGNDDDRGGFVSSIVSLVTPVLLALVFFLVVTPVALVYRLFSKDPMNRNFNDGKSYRVLNEKPDHKNLEKPY